VEARVRLARLLYVQGSLSCRADVLEDAIKQLQQAAALEPLNMQIRDELCGASRAKSRIDGSMPICK